MNCVEFSPDHLPDLAALLNKQLAGVPPGWKLTEEQVARTIGMASNLWSVHYPDQKAAFELETLCVLDDRCLLSIAQYGVPVQQESRGIDSSSVLFWVVAEPDVVEGARLLLETIAARSRAAGSPRITTARFSFGVGWLGLQAAWSSVMEALPAAGFVASSRWVILTAPVSLREVFAPESLASMKLSWHADADTAEWDLRLYAGDKLVGECQAWGIPGHFSGCEGYSNWVTLEWCGVEPEYRRKGIGSWLMAEQLRRQAQQGVTNAVMWTETDNMPALGLAESLGFKVGPECLDFEKDLSGRIKARRD